MTEVSTHEPVLLKEVLQFLDPRPKQFVIDGTVNGGGHARAILEKIMPGGTLLGVDWDAAMIAKKKPESKTEHYAHGNYAELPAILKKEKLGLADGLLLDLGFSSEQLAQSGRGFSFGGASADEPLKMTYEDSQTPLAELLRMLSEKELADVIYEFGGERRSRAIAKAIVMAGKQKRITTSGELAKIVRDAMPGNYEHGRIDAATRTFQALRIYANDELGNLKKLLGALHEIVKPGGRVAIISFHSLEDRIVKQAFQQGMKEKTLELLTKKPIVPTHEEEMQNPRSRSAKLRAAVVQRTNT